MERRLFLKISFIKLSLMIPPPSLSLSEKSSDILNKNRKIQTFVFDSNINQFDPDKYFDMDLIDNWKRHLGAVSQSIFVKKNTAINFSSLFPRAINKDIYVYLVLKNHLKVLKKRNINLITNNFRFSHLKEKIIREIKRRNLEKYI